MTKTITCILCPNGCEMTVEYADASPILRAVRGNRCPKGSEYAEKELTAPVRTISSSVFVQNGSLPLCSVRLTKPVPKEKIPEIMAEIRTVRLTAPVHIGQIIIPHILGFGQRCHCHKKYRLCSVGLSRFNTDPVLKSQAGSGRFKKASSRHSAGYGPVCRIFLQTKPISGKNRLPYRTLSCF